MAISAKTSDARTQFRDPVRVGNDYTRFSANPRPTPTQTSARQTTAAVTKNANVRHLPTLMRLKTSAPTAAYTKTKSLDKPTLYQ